MDVRGALQKAIFEELTSADYTPDTVAVYDAIPQNESYPFISIGDIDVRPWQTDEVMGYRAESRLYVHTSQMGRAQVLRIMGVIEDTLNRAEIELEYDGHVVTVDFLFSSTSVEADGTVRTGRIDFAWTIGGRV